jgi:hypothetical protein
MSHRVTAFKHWVHEIWLQNCDERFEVNQPRLSISEYISQHKYWLRAQYRQQQ